MRSERRYLPTLAELIDRLSIVQMKAIFIPEHRDAYREEITAIEHDIDLLLRGRALTARDLRAAQVVMLANRVIWENESKARQGGDEQDRLLKFTHSVNGVRNTAKNVIARNGNDRVDHKVDCFAAGPVEGQGDWSIW